MMKRAIIVLTVLVLASSALAQLVEKLDLQGQMTSRSVVTATGTTTSRSLADRFADSVNAADFGAKTSIADNTAAINAAAMALSARGTKGACIKFGEGTYRVAGTITLPSSVSLCGIQKAKTDSGAIGTLLWGTGSNGQILIDIGNGSDNPNFNMVKDITIGFANTQSLGAGVRVRNGHNITLRDLVFGLNVHDSIVLMGGPGQYNYFLSDIEILAGRRGVWVGAPVSGKSALVQNVTLRNVSVGNVSDAGFYLQNVGGLQGCIGCETLSTARGLVIAPGNNEKVEGILWHGGFLDHNTNGGLVIAPTGSACTMWTSNALPLCGMASQISFVNVRPSYSVGSMGVLIDSTGGGLVKGISFTNLEAGLNYAEGVKILGSNTSQIHFVNPRISYNNVGNADKSGLYVGSGVTGVSVVGGCASTCSQQHPDTVNRQTYGLQFASGASYWTVMGVNLTSNVAGPISYDTNEVNKSILGNIGVGDQIAQGPFRVIDTTTGNAGLVVDGTLNTMSGGSIWLRGDGVSTPNKWIRAHQGEVQIVNDASSAIIARISDAGKLTLKGGITASIPTSCSGQPPGTFWNDGGTVKVCP